MQIPPGISSRDSFWKSSWIFLLKGLKLPPRFSHGCDVLEFIPWSFLGELLRDLSQNSSWDYSKNVATIPLGIPYKIILSTPLIPSKCLAFPDSSGIAGNLSGHSGLPSEFYLEFTSSNSSIFLDFTLECIHFSLFIPWNFFFIFLLEF